VERAGLEFAVECPSGEPAVLVDPDLWEKIVLNLLSNAVKFTLAGRVGISLVLSRGIAEPRVADTGVGIAPEEVPLLFQRFHQVRGAAGRSHEGSGIGLALVRELAALHGGGIEAASEIPTVWSNAAGKPSTPASNAPASLWRTCALSAPSRPPTTLPPDCSTAFTTTTWPSCSSAEVTPPVGRSVRERERVPADPACRGR
jgi:hypothetical protein